MKNLTIIKTTLQTTFVIVLISLAFLCIATVVKADFAGQSQNIICNTTNNNVVYTCNSK